MSSRHKTDFFERQDDSRKKTARLLVMLVVAVVVLSMGTFAVALGCLLPVVWFVVESIWEVGWDGPWDVYIPWVEVMLLSVAVTGGFIVIASLIKRRHLKEGGAALIEGLDGVEVNSHTADSQRLELVNVVEEMAIAAGIPVPRVYVLEGQPGINAFAAGFTANDAAIAVTDTAVEQLNRDELQAVVAHEFSHILNGDTRLNLRLIGIVHGLMLPYLTGKTLMSMGRGGGRLIRLPGDLPTFEGMLNLVAGFLMIIFVVAPAFVFAYAGRVGAAFADGIKSAISRQREFVADAAAVQFTRNPDAMVSALEKIRAHADGSRLGGPRALEVSHMCFGNVATRGSLVTRSVLSTHPSLEHRISELGGIPETTGHWRVFVREDLEAVDGEDGGIDENYGEPPPGLKPGEVVEQVAEPTPEKIAYCASVLDELPNPLRQARGDLLGATAIACLLVLDPDDEIRDRQSEVFNEHANNGLIQECNRLWPYVARLERRMELPLIDLVYPALRRMTPDQFQRFREMLDAMVHVQGELMFRDFIIEWVLLHRLEMALGDADRDIVQHRSMRGMVPSMQVVLSCVAKAGNSAPEDAKQAFETARQGLPKAIRDDVEFQPPANWDYDDVGEALDRLSVASANIKRIVVEATSRCVVADERIAVGELEIFRAVTEALDVPVGPLATRRRERG